MEQNKQPGKITNFFNALFLLMLVFGISWLIFRIEMQNITVNHINDKTATRATFLTREDMDTYIRDYVLLDRYPEFVDWLTTHTDNKKVTQQILSALYNSNVPILLYFALIDTESNFNPSAQNHNPNGTIDIGIGQLNSFTYAQYPVEILFDSGWNLKKSVEQLEQNYIRTLSWTKSVIQYNCGLPTTIPLLSIDYLNIILKKEERLTKEFAFEFLE